MDCVEREMNEWMDDKKDEAQITVLLLTIDVINELN